MLSGCLYAQILNVTQASVIEGFAGKNPNLTGASAVFVQGNYAYTVGTGDVLQILDITMPGLPLHFPKDEGNLYHGTGGASILRVQNIVVRGDYAYMTSYGGDALEIVDVSDPSKPVHKGVIYDGKGSAPYLAGATGLAIVGDYAYVTGTNSKALEIIDISNPSDPKHKGSLLGGTIGTAPFLSLPITIFVSGNFAFIGNLGGPDPMTNPSALEIVDISNPSLPVHKGAIPLGNNPNVSYPYGIAVSGNYAYVTDFANDALEIIDVSNLALPVQKGKLVDGGGNQTLPYGSGSPPYLLGAWGVHISGNYAFIGLNTVVADPNPNTSYTGALEVVDISNPALPFHAGALFAEPIAYARNMHVVGDKAYIPSRTNGSLSIVSLTNPISPKLISTASNGIGGALINEPSTVVVYENYAYIGNRSSKIINGPAALEIVNITDPTQPVHEASLDKNTGASVAQVSSLYKKSNYLFLTSDIYNSLQIVDVTVPSIPIKKGLITGNPSVPILVAKSVVADPIATRAYVASGGYNLFINPENPPPNQTIRIRTSQAYTVSFYGTGSITFSGASYSGSLVGTGANNKVTTTFTPLLGFINCAFTGDISTPRFVPVSGNEPGSNAISVIDYTNPDLPVLTGTLLDGIVGSPYLKGAWSMVQSGSYLYVASKESNALEIVNVQTPDAPSHKGFILDGNGSAPYLLAPVSVAVQGRYAYVVSKGSKALEIVDIFNPASPVHAGSFVDPVLLEGVNSVKVSGNYAYITRSTFVLGAPNFDSGILVVIDISNPATPFLVDTFKHNEGGSLIDSPTSVFISGSYAYITNAGLSQNLNVAYLYGPSITNVVPASAPVGASVTIQGNNFNTFLTVAVNGTTTKEKPNVTETTLTFTVPPGATNGKIGLTLNGQTILSTNNFIVIPTATAATAVQQTSVVTNWSNVGAAGYYLDLSTDNFNTFVTDYSNRSVGNVTSLAIGGLTAGISYQYRVRSSDGVTTSGNSNTVDVLTIPATPVTTAATSITQTSFTLNWNGVTGATGYRLDVASDDSFTKFLTGLENLLVSSISQTINVNPRGATYYYRVRAVNASGTSPFSIVASVITIPVAPSSNLANAITSTSFTANWALVSGASEYYLDVSTDNFITLLPDYTNKPVGNVVSSAISGLLSGTTYYYRIRAANVSGASGNSNSITVFTLTPVPAAQATALTFSNTSGSSTTVSFEAAAGNPTGYLVLRANGSLPNAPPANGTIYAIGATLGNVSIAYAGPSLSFFDGGLPTAITYYYRVYSFNGSGAAITYLTTNPLQGKVTLDVLPPSISAPVIPNPSTINGGNTPNFNTIITDNVTVSSAKIFYRGISQKSFKSAPLSPSGSTENYTVQIQTNWYDSLGLEYYFWAVDQNGNQTAKPTLTNTAQLITSFNIPALPSGTSESNYGIISFPYKLSTDNKVTTVYPGVPWNDDTKAAMWWWDPALKDGSGDYNQYGKGNNAFETVDPGKGYWAIVGTPASPQLSNVIAPKYNQSNLFSMTLKPKWNQIGNPYPVPISWDDVIAYNQNSNPNAVFSPLNKFDGTGYKEAKELKAFEGGFVKNLGSSDITIQIPFPGQSGNGGRKASIASNISQDNWNIFLHINQNNFTNQLGGFGMHPLAQSGQDRFDNFNPPRFMDVPEVNFVNKDFSSSVFSKDMVKSQENYTWQFTPNGTIGQATQLNWSPDISTGSSKQLFLLDEEQLNIIDMLSSSSYNFTFTNNSRFRIFYGRDIKDQITTLKVVASAPYPNPVSSEVMSTINLALPDMSGEYQINLQIYNSRGDLLETINKKYKPGIHHLEFSLANPALTSGMYIYTLAVTSGQSSTVYNGKIIKP